MKNTKNTNPNQDNAETPSLSERIAHTFDKQKHQLADLLNRHSEKLSLRNKKIVLLLFGIVMGSISLTLLMSPFHHVNTNTSIFSEKSFTPSIEVPPIHSEPFISPEHHNLLTGFKKTMDSLKKHDPFTYDEILKDRKGLLDTINLLLKLY